MRPLFVIATVLVGCAASPMDSGQMMNAQEYTPPIPAAAQTETVRRIALQPDMRSDALSFSGIHTQRRQAIQDAATWAAVWPQIFGDMPAPELPAVDFSKETVLLAAMGDAANSGYSIQIDGAFADGDTTTAGVTSVSPDPMCMMTMMQVMTQPVDVVVVPKASAVTFAERGSMSMCGGMPMGMNR
jgi:hypothetical protein